MTNNDAATTAPTGLIAHTINNSEVGTTECGLLNDVPARIEGEWSTEPVAVLSLSARGQVAVWDNVPPPAGHSLCAACFKAYNEVTA